MMRSSSRGEVVAVFVLMSLLGNLAVAQDGGGATASREEMSPSGNLLQYGEMHKVIGMKQHQPRVRLGDLTAKSHLYAVGALEGLKGEITVVNGTAVVTSVDDRQQPLAMNAEARDLQATMLIGAYVPEWREIEIPTEMNDSELDAFIQMQIERLGGDPQLPTMFRIEGTFAEVGLHVINGACPVHARIRQLKLPAEEKPLEMRRQGVQGMIVGVFADNAVGKITHPTTRSHKHLVLTSGRDVQELNGQALTGHIESVVVTAKSRLFLPR